MFQRQFVEEEGWFRQGGDNPRPSSTDTSPRRHRALTVAQCSEGCTAPWRLSSGLLALPHHLSSASKPVMPHLPIKNRTKKVAAREM